MQGIYLWVCVVDGGWFELRTLISKKATGRKASPGPGDQSA